MREDAVSKLTVWFADEGVDDGSRGRDALIRRRIKCK